MIVDVSPKAKVIYQSYQDGEDFEGPGEPAIILHNYDDCICMQTESGFVNINRSTVAELVKVLKEFSKV